MTKIETVRDVMKFILGQALLDLTETTLMHQVSGGCTPGMIEHGDDKESVRINLTSCASMCGLEEGSKLLTTKVWTGELSTFHVDEDLLSKVREVYPDVVTLIKPGLGEHPYFNHDGEGLYLRQRGTFPRNPDAKRNPTMPERPAGTSTAIAPDGSVAHVYASEDHVDKDAGDSDWSAPVADPSQPNW